MGQHAYAPIRWFFRVSLLLLTLNVGATILTDPAVVTTAGTQALVYLVLFILAILIYSWVALVRTRAATPAERIAVQQGTFWGLLCGGAWIIELLVANLPGWQPGWLNPALYFGSAAIGYLLPVLAGLLAAWCSAQIRAGIEAGLLCGMFGGIMIFLASMAMSVLLLRAGQADPQTLREFQRSGLPDLRTYLVGDYLAAMIAHLWIGLITGFVFGVVGGVLGKALARSPNAIEAKSS